MRRPSAMAARMRSTATCMSPSRSGSCSGCSPAKKARASSGSPYPRRTSTLAVISLMPSPWARTLDSRCGHGRIVHVPCSIARPRYGGRRTDRSRARLLTAARGRFDRCSTQFPDRRSSARGRGASKHNCDQPRALVCVLVRGIDFDVVRQSGNTAESRGRALLVRVPPADLRAEFLLDPDIVFLNHGSFGACPRAVFERYREWQRGLERRPVEFLARRLDGLLADSRAALAAYVSADPDDLVCVPNVTAGINVAAWALDLQPGDEVLSTDLEYGALDLAWDHVCQYTRARYVRMPVTLPLRNHAESLEEIWAGVTERTRALFLSHVTSETAVQLPVEELCARAREAAIATIVDGAHVPAHIPLDLAAIGADYYSGNCHKWLCAPKGSAFLHVRRELQPNVHPLVIGWGYKDDATFLSRHEGQGTRDPSAFLTVPDAIEWQRQHDWEAVRERCRALT